MFKSRRAVHTALAVLLSIFLLAACGGEEPEETEASPTTGNTGAFEITGTVQTVEIEGGEASPGATGTATPTNASPTAGGTASPTAGGTASPTGGGTASPTGPQALLVVEIENITPRGPAVLCDVEEGDQVTLTVTPTTAIEPQRSLEELDDLEGRSIRAEGNAEELAAEDRGGSPAAGEEDTGSPTATGTASPTPTGTASPTATGTATGTASPTGTGGTAGAGGTDEDPEAGCHWEVARLVIEEAEEGETAGGAGTGSPTPAPAGGQGMNTSPTPTDRRTPGATTPTSGGGGT